ncbi:solute carrier family 22 member 3-like [Anticarsia gemmatalis]|uniref:solute carrier family 22 member 3-like n=1 Tax=Anticarsia gemmatalis TaxID=129554 RepID=UPI003F762742
MSDKIGRKRMVIFNMLAAGILGVTKSAVTSYWVFIALEMLEPLFGECYSTIFTLAVEMVTKKHRPVMIVVLSTFATIGQILMAVIAYYTPEWRNFLICIYAPGLFIIMYSFLMDESLRWLLIKGKKAEAEEIIRAAAKMNKIKVDENALENLKCEEEVTSAMSLSSALSGLILLYVLTKFKRKGPLILALTLTGLFCMTQAFVPKEYRWLSTLLYLCGKVNASISLRVSYLYTTELFPTYTRNTMLALCSSLGRTATLLAPQTPLLLKYWSGLPSLLVGILSLMTASVVTLMPDTSEDVLPDNVRQAEIVGTKKEKEMCSKL